MSATTPDAGKGTWTVLRDRLRQEVVDARILDANLAGIGAQQADISALGETITKMAMAVKLLDRKIFLTVKLPTSKPKLSPDMEQSKANLIQRDILPLFDTAQFKPHPWFSIHRHYEHLLNFFRSDVRLVIEFIHALSLPELGSVFPALYALYGQLCEPIEHLQLVMILVEFCNMEIQTCPRVASHFRTNSHATKLLGSYVRHAGGLAYLHDTLAPLVAEVLEEAGDDWSVLETNPASIYHALGLGTTATTTAMQYHPKVQERLERNIHTLLVFAEKFLAAIESSVDQVPYGLRWVTREIVRLGRQKWELSVADENALAGSFVFLRFLVPAIVQPDSFGLVSEDRQISSAARTSFKNIGKVLLALSNGVPFGDKDPTMKRVDDEFVIAHRERLRRYLARFTGVASLALRVYSDSYVIPFNRQTTISIGLLDLINIHKLLVHAHDTKLHSSRVGGAKFKSIIERLGPVVEYSSLGSSDQKGESKWTIVWNVPMINKMAPKPPQRRQSMRQDSSVPRDVIKARHKAVKHTMRLMVSVKDALRGVLGDEDIDMSWVEEAADSNADMNVQLRALLAVEEMRASQSNNTAHADSLGEAISLLEDLEHRIAELRGPESPGGRDLDEVLALDPVTLFYRDLYLSEMMALWIGQERGHVKQCAEILNVQYRQVKAEVDMFGAYYRNMHENIFKMRSALVHDPNAKKLVNIIGPVQFTWSEVRSIPGLVESSSLDKHAKKLLKFSVQSRAPGRVGFTVSIVGSARGTVESSTSFAELCDSESSSYALPEDTIVFNANLLCVFVAQNLFRT